MMAIVLFALIGAIIKAGTAYWICFSIYCFLQLLVIISKIILKIAEKEEEEV